MIFFLAISILRAREARTSHWKQSPWETSLCSCILFGLQLIPEGVSGWQINSNTILCHGSLPCMYHSHRPLIHFRCLPCQNGGSTRVLVTFLLLWWNTKATSERKHLTGLMISKGLSPRWQGEEGLQAGFWSSTWEIAQDCGRISDHIMNWENLVVVDPTLAHTFNPRVFCKQD